MKISKRQLIKLIKEELSRVIENIDYKKAYKKYHSSTKAKKARAQRNRIGRQIKKAGIEIPDGYEIDHIKPIEAGGDNDLSNIQIISRKENRSKGQEITTRKRKKNKTY